MMRKKLLFILILSGLWIFPLFVPSLSAQDFGPEKILSFHSKIIVHPDASMTVTETIMVNSTGREIKRGIYRDFPTRYRDRMGNKYVVDFNVVEVLKDGQPENYRLKHLSNGERVYIGKEDVYLNPGEYTYTITYKTNRQIGFFEDFDELYWNVTGNGWSFLIEEASAVVRLPAGVLTSVITLDGYTGRFGSKEKNFTASADISGKISFTTTRPLAPEEGLTIVISWPKGYVEEPTRRMKFLYFIRDNKDAISGVIGILAVFIYYMMVWARFGKDPARGTIIPLYNPPEEFSPAVVRYLMKMGFDNKAFTAAIINMAVKGFLKIKEESGVYTLTKTGKEEAVLTKEELAAAHRLFGSTNEVKLKNENHSKISGALTKLETSLRNNFEKIYFLTNKKYFISGLVISAIFMIICILLASGEKLPMAVFICIWLTGWTFGVVFLVKQVGFLWKGVFSHGSGKPALLGGAISMSLFALPFIIGELVGFGMFIFAASLSAALILAAVLFINVVFYHLLKAPTIKGRKIMDKIEGFKMYLSVAEKERLNLLNPPEETPELFEKYLPYAFALDVEQAWAEKFAGVFKKITESGGEYSPDWYSGRAWNIFAAGSFSSALGNSLSGAISSSSVAPGSSSGGGGGGSSGGGGGGGGGGGW